MFTRSDNGPQSDGATINGNAESQRTLYNELKEYMFTPPDCNTGCDYFTVGEVQGIEYYAPNDESWGSIVAIDHSHQVAALTGFYDMFDMTDPDVDYAMRYDGEKLSN